MTGSPEGGPAGYDFRVEDIRSLTIIWAALCSGVALYTLVVFGLTLTGSVEPALPGIAMTIAVPFALLWLGAITLFRRSAIRNLVAVLEPPQRFEKYRIMVITMLAMMEFGGLMMITVGLMTGEPGWVLAGGGAATFLMVRARPSIGEISDP